LGQPLVIHLGYPGDIQGYILFDMIYYSALRYIPQHEEKLKSPHFETSEVSNSNNEDKTPINGLSKTRVLRLK
jgi:hypothetical protein